MANLVLDLNPQPMVSGAQRAETALRGVKDQARDSEQASRRLERSMAMAGRGAGRFGNSARQLSMQLSQVGQMGAVTGNWMQALAIQLPDIGLAFGAVGTAVGLLAGVGLPMLTQAFSRTSDSAGWAQTGIEDLNGALVAMDDLARVSGTTLDDYLNVAFRESAAAVRELVNALREARFDAAMSEVQSAVSEVTDQIDHYLGAWDAVDKIGTDAFQSGIDSGNEFALKLADIINEAGATGSELEALRASVEEIGQAASMDEFVSALADARAEAESIGGPVGAAIIDALTDMAGNAGVLESIISGAADQASRLSSNLGASWTKTSAIIQEDAAMSVSLTPVALPDNPFDTGGGTGSRGMSEIEKLTQEYETLRGSIDPAWQAQQQYNDAVETLDRAMSAGLISSQAQYNQLLEEAQAKFLGAAGAAEQFQVVGDVLADAFSRSLDVLFDMTSTAEEKMQALKDIALDVVDQLLQALVIQPAIDALTGSLSGALGGSFFSFDGGGYTGDGARTGGLDGKGGYLAMIHPQETVIDHTKGQSASGSGRVELVIRTDQGVFVETVRNEAGAMISQAAPGIVGQSVSAVRGQMKRTKGFAN